jgi:hypothetical protein
LITADRRRRLAVTDAASRDHFCSIIPATIANIAIARMITVQIEYLRLSAMSCAVVVSSVV